MKKPDALLVTTPSCPHCPGVKRSLVALLGEGALANLEIVDAVLEPDRAKALGVKTVPWTRIGPFELEGAITPADLREWAAAAVEGRKGKGMARYFERLLTAGKRSRVEAMVREAPERLTAFVQLLADPQVGINARLGLTVVLEELHGSGLARRIADGLASLLEHDDARVRGDACYALSLSDSPTARQSLEKALADPHPDVREIAAEGLETLQIDGDIKN